MSALIKVFFALFFIGSSFSVLGATIPADSLGSQQYDALKCISQAKDVCINSICLNSNQRNCQGNCAAMAEQKCRHQTNQ